MSAFKAPPFLYSMFDKLQTSWQDSTMPTLNFKQIKATFLLIDMALTRIQSGKWWVGLVLSGCGYYNDMEHNYVFSGAKEINLTASVEHLRDNRPHMVKTKVCTCV